MRGKIPIQEFTTPFVTTIPVGRWEQSNNIYKVSIASPSVDENSILDVTVDANTGNNLLSSIYVKPTSTGFDICTDVLPAGSVTVGIFNKGALGPATYELAADVVNNTTTTTAGKVLDARVGKTLQDEITEIQGATPLILAITSGQWSGSGNDYYLEVSASNVTQNSILVPSYDSASAQYLGGPVWCVPADGSFTIHTSKLPTGTVKIMVQFHGVVGIADFQVLSDVYSKSQTYSKLEAVAKTDIVNNLTSDATNQPLSAAMGKSLANSDVKTKLFNFTGITFEAGDAGTRATQLSKSLEISGTVVGIAIIGIEFSNQLIPVVFVMNSTLYLNCYRAGNVGTTNNAVYIRVTYV